MGYIKVNMATFKIEEKLSMESGPMVPATAAAGHQSAEVYPGLLNQNLQR